MVLPIPKVTLGSLSLNVSKVISAALGLLEGDVPHSVSIVDYIGIVILWLEASFGERSSRASPSTEGLQNSAVLREITRSASTHKRVARADFNRFLKIAIKSWSVGCVASPSAPM